MRWSVSALIILFALPAPAKSPKWLDHEVMVGGTKEAPILYGVGRQTASRFCDSRWLSQSISIAGSRARTAIAELLGMTDTRVEDRASVRDTEVRIKGKYENNHGCAEKTDDEVTIHDERVSTTATRATGRGLPGVRALRAWYDPESRAIYVLSAKKVAPEDVEGLELEALPKLEGMTLREVELAMKKHCGG